MTVRLPDPLLFVGGTPRSGTTMLRNMLDSHPQVAVPAESHFITDVYSQLTELGRLDDLDVAWHLIRHHPRFQMWELPEVAVEAALSECAPTTYADLVRTLFSAHARLRAKQQSADKTTIHAQHFLWLAAQFPGSRFVHVLRDPREVCMSLALKYWNRGGVLSAAEQWVIHVRAARSAAAALGGRQREIRYEDLVADPAKQLQRMCDLAGLSFEPSMLRYAERGHGLLGGEYALAREAPRRGVRRWQEEMSHRDVALVEAIAGPVMDEVGYTRVTQTRWGRRQASQLRLLFVEARDGWYHQGAPLVRAMLRTRKDGPHPTAGPG